jgi:hypothetical protein
MPSKAFVYPVCIKSSSVPVFLILRLPFDTGGPQVFRRDRAGAMVRFEAPSSVEAAIEYGVCFPFPAAGGSFSAVCVADRLFDG